MKNIKVSVVAPVYNEEDNVGQLFTEIISSTQNHFKEVEVVLVNDGSKDSSLKKMLEIRKKDNRLKVIDLRRNYGQTPATAAGFSLCTGDVVVTLDSDLQNDPVEIPRLVSKLIEGDYDIVNGWRKERKDKFLTRKLPSFLGNKLVSWITGVKLHDYGCALRAFKSDVVKNLTLYGEMHRYLPAIASTYGIKSVEIPVKHRPRIAGKSKYGLSRTFKVIIDLISLKYLLSFSSRPLLIFGSLGLFLSMCGFLSGVYLTYLKYFLNQGIWGRPLLFFTMLTLFLGFQLISLGLIAEMLTRVYHDGLNKESYKIRKTYGFENENINDSA